MRIMKIVVQHLATRYSNQWVVVDKGYNNYHFKPHYADTNGTISRFYFGLTDNFATAAAATDDSAMIIVDENNTNKGAARFIWVEDDDGFVRGARFVVFADSAPPVPLPAGPGIDTSYFTNVPVVLKWTGFDKHDSIETEYAVLVNPPGENTPEETVQTYKKATQYVLEGNVITFNYAPPLPGVYSWRIVARDIRNSVSSSVTRQFSHPGQ